MIAQPRARRWLSAGLCVALLVVGCHKTNPSSSAGPSGSSATAHLAATSASAASSIDRTAIDRAENLRDPAAIPGELASSDDPAIRAMSARALAQMAGVNVEPRLAAALSDESPATVRWAAYGLGLPCDVDPDFGTSNRARIVAMLSARLASLQASNVDSSIAWQGIAWALGRCGESEAASVLRTALAKRAPVDQQVLAAFGAISQRTHGLEDDVVSALVARARVAPGRDPEALALWPLTRGDWGARPSPLGLADASKELFSAPRGELAIRAYARSKEPPLDPLRAVLASPTTSATAKVEALKALRRLGDAGLAEIAAFATRHAPPTPIDPANPAIAALKSSNFGALLTAVELLAEAEPSATRDTSLRAFTFAGPIPSTVGAASARRLAKLRCAAIIGMRPSAPADPELFHCADLDVAAPAALRASHEIIRDHARLSSLDRGEISAGRRDAWETLAKSGSLTVRERALGIGAKHPEIKASPAILVGALSAKELGLVASAAQAIETRPSLAMRPAAPTHEAIAAALDPKVSAPSVTEQREAPDPAVIKALEGAMARPLEEADAEIKASLAAAAGAIRMSTARGYLARLCGDRALALRLAAKKALAALDPKSTDSCAQIIDHGTPSPRVGTSVARFSLRFDIEGFAEPLFFDIDPDTAPIAASTVRELANGRFYDGVVIHRVVPGFVVQLGDPGGDGFGGAHVALRCETAPVPFESWDIGVALAGRDTGSSQLFVTLGRTPHLDGSYAHLGHARGAWDAIAEGDVITKVRVE